MPSRTLVAALAAETIGTFLFFVVGAGAVIMDARNFGLFVELPEFLLTGLIHISTLEGDFFVHDAPRCRIVGRRTKKVYQVGDIIEVAVDRVDMLKQQVDFKLAKDRA